MDTVVYVISILMWILCPAIIGLILLQGAAGDISSAFGGGGQLDASLGVGAHRKMAQVTGALAVLFFIMVLFMAYPHRGSFQNVKNDPAPAVAPAATPEAAKPVEPAKPAVQPEAVKPAEAGVEPAKPAEAGVEPAKPAEPAPAPQPEPAKPAESAPVSTPTLVPSPAPVEPAKPAEPAPASTPVLVPAPAPAEPAKP